MQNQGNQNTINVLVSQYEAMSQKGVVGFIEETVFGQLVDYYLAGQHNQRVVEVLQHAIEQHPYSAGFYIRYGEILIYNGHFEEALSTLDQAAMYEPNSTTISIFKINALMQLKNYDEAYNLLQQLKSFADSRSLSKIYCIEAELQEIRGNYNEVYYSLEASLEADAQNIQALEMMMWAVEMNGNYDESVSLHKRIIDKFPYSDNAWFNLGHAYTGLDEQEYAAEAFEYAYIVNPENEYAYRECVSALIKLGQYEQALSCYEEALVYITPDTSLLLDIGACYEALDQYNVAIKYYSDVLEMSPKSEEVYYRLGKCYSKTSNYVKAIALLEKAISLNDRKEEYLLALADVLYAVGDVKNALTTYQKAADTAPEMSEYWLKYALFLNKTHCSIKALEVLDEAELYVDSTDLQYCRILCLFELGKESKALYYLGEALAVDYDGHLNLLDWAPALRDNDKIETLLAKYNPY